MKLFTIIVVTITMLNVDDISTSSTGLTVEQLRAILSLQTNESSVLFSIGEDNIDCSHCTYHGSHYDGISQICENTHDYNSDNDNDNTFIPCSDAVSNITLDLSHLEPNSQAYNVTAPLQNLSCYEFKYYLNSFGRELCNRRPFSFRRSCGALSNDHYFLEDDPYQHFSEYNWMQIRHQCRATCFCDYNYCERLTFENSFTNEYDWYCPTQFKPQIGNTCDEIIRTENPCDSSLFNNPGLNLCFTPDLLPNTEVQQHCARSCTILVHTLNISSPPLSPPQLPPPPSPPASPPGCQLGTCLNRSNVRPGYYYIDYDASCMYSLPGGINQTCPGIPDTMGKGNGQCLDGTRQLCFCIDGCTPSPPPGASAPYSDLFTNRETVMNRMCNNSFYVDNSRITPNRHNHNSPQEEEVNEKAGIFQLTGSERQKLLLLGEDVDQPVIRCSEILRELEQLEMTLSDFLEEHPECGVTTAECTPTNRTCYTTHTYQETIQSDFSIRVGNQTCTSVCSSFGETCVTPSSTGITAADMQCRVSTEQTWGGQILVTHENLGTWPLDFPFAYLGTSNLRCQMSSGLSWISGLPVYFRDNNYVYSSSNTDWGSCDEIKTFPHHQRVCICQKITPSTCYHEVDPTDFLGVIQSDPLYFTCSTSDLSTEGFERNIPPSPYPPPPPPRPSPPPPNSPPGIPRDQPQAPPPPPHPPPLPPPPNIPSRSCRICQNDCGDSYANPDFDSDGECDDGGPGAEASICPVGTECTDCGNRSCINEIIDRNMPRPSNQLGCQDHQCMDIESSEECNMAATEFGYEYYGSIDDFMTNYTAFHCLGIGIFCIEGNILNNVRLAHPGFASLQSISWNESSFEGFAAYCAALGNSLSGEYNTTAYRGRCPASYSASRCLGCRTDPLQHEGKTKSQMLRGCFLCNSNCHPILHNKFVWNDRELNTTGSDNNECGVNYANCICTCPVNPQGLSGNFRYGLTNKRFTPIRGT